MLCLRCSERGQRKGLVSVFHPHPGEQGHEGRHRGQGAHHGWLEQLPRTFLGPPGEGSRDRGDEEMGHQLLGIEVPQRHTRPARGAGSAACAFREQAERPVLHDRLPDKPGRNLRPSGQGRARLLRQAQPRVDRGRHLSRRRHEGPSARAPLHAQQHGQPEEVPRRGAPGRRQARGDRRRVQHGGGHRQAAADEGAVHRVWREAVPRRGARPGRPRPHGPGHGRALRLEKPRGHRHVHVFQIIRLPRRVRRGRP